ncbi:hypothetical protein cand_019920 [Cryptosporidium andersoni]|uniref:Thioredoxin domain-containing protein n=1 Tax=Cryptosporidium andersoni TaxID=117008 RepID=A0A1J4MSR3_9CRYT|nr:hypothetical protein cand_019920 [Cryptosporidium andersoni]
MEERLASKVQKIVIDTLEEQENILDEELKRLDQICKDDDELEQIRSKRISQMKMKYELNNKYRSLGHGDYSEITSERDFFDIIKRSDRVICHFFRPTTVRCQIFDKHLAILSSKHIETRFIKINAEKALFLCGNLGIHILPTLVCIINTDVRHKIIGFEELGSKDDFKTFELEQLLIRWGVLLLNS